MIRQGFVCYGIVALLSQCTPARDSDKVAPQETPALQTERQAVTNLLELYQTAMSHEDIDRLQELLQRENLASQARHVVTSRVGDKDFWDVATFSDKMSEAFRAVTLLALQMPPDEIQIADDLSSVTFVEVESVEDTKADSLLEQHTRLFRSTWQITRKATEGKIAFRIVAVRREGPLVRIITPGQVQAGALTRIMVDGTGTPFSLASVEIQGAESEAWQALVSAARGHFHGAFLPPSQGSCCLPVRLRGEEGEDWRLEHCYRLRRGDEGVLQQVMRTEDMRFFALAVGQDGTIWAGGDATQAGTIGIILHITDGGSRQLFEPELPPENLRREAHGRIEDIVVDQHGRVHFLFLARVNSEVVASGDVIWDPQYPEAGFCQTVNVATDIAYPFPAPRNPQQRSPSTRLAAAEGRDVWLVGSDGSVARVRDNFREGKCPSQGVGA